MESQQKVRDLGHRQRLADRIRDKHKEHLGRETSELSNRLLIRVYGESMKNEKKS
jgi:hypothetical protein